MTFQTSPGESYEQARLFLSRLYAGMEGYAGIFFRKDTKDKHSSIVSLWLSVAEIRNLSRENWRRVCVMNVEQKYHVEIKTGTFQRKLEVNEQGKYADLLHSRIFAADIDVSGGTAENMPEIIKKPLVTPSWAVFSGGGYHLYWQLDTPLDMTTSDGIDLVKQYRLGLAHELKGDESLQSPTHPLRMPFTYNQKEAKYGFNNVMCYTLPEWCSGVIYDIGFFKYHRVFKPKMVAPLLSADEAEVILRRRGGLVRHMLNLAMNAPEGRRNRQLYESAIALGTLITSAADEDEFRLLLENAATVCGLVEDDQNSVKNTITSGIRAGKVKGNHSIGQDTAWRSKYGHVR